VIVELPSVASQGAATATGALVFGIGTEANNGLGSASILSTDPNVGTIQVTFNGVHYPQSALDSGSSAYFLTDGSLSPCAAGTPGEGFFCTAANLSATITTLANTQLTANFTVGDASTMFAANPSFAAFPQLAAPAGAMASQTFDFGITYFYGRNVFSALETRNAGGTTGPYFAY
jgi:hypothetical protein